MLETRKVDNNNKALFVNLRPLDMYALLQQYSGVLQMCRSSVVNKMIRHVTFGYLIS